MESPVKKLNFNAADKENQPLDQTTASTETKSVEQTKEMVKQEKPTVAPGIKAEEVDEPLLQENPHRFVLFPIKYHEVCDASTTRKVVSPHP